LTDSTLLTRPLVKVTYFGGYHYTRRRSWVAC
jgi:hypothetical protein